MRRRQALATFGAATSFGIAGCAGGSDDENEDDGDESTTDTDGGTEIETDTAAETTEGTQETEEPESTTEEPAEVRTVEPGDSIQSAVDDIDAGGTVEVVDGTYEQAVAIDEELSLVAPDGATLDGVDVDSGAAITTSAPGVTVEGFEIIRYEEQGIATTEEVETITVADVSFLDNPGAALSVEAATIDVSGVVVENNGGAPLVLDSTRDGAVELVDVTVEQSAGTAAAITGGKSVVVDSFEALQNESAGLDVQAEDVRGQSVEITDSSVIEQRGGDGIQVSGTSGDDDVTITNTEVRDNAGAGVDVAGKVVELTGVTATGNGPTTAGVSIASTSEGTVTITDTTVENTDRDSSWGDDQPGRGIYVTNGKTVTVENVSLVQNGGYQLRLEAENVRGQTVDVSDSTVDENSSGAGISIAGSIEADDVSVTNTDILAHDGNGLFVGSGGENDVTIKGVESSNNGEDGIHVAGWKTLTVEDVSSLKNSGIGLEVLPGDVRGRTATVSKSTFQGNGEGGLDITGDDLEIVDVASKQNDGEGLYIGATSEAPVTVRNATVEDNKGSYTSHTGIYIRGGKTVTVDNASVLRNSANGIVVDHGDVSGQTVKILDSVVKSNSSDGVWLSGTTGTDEMTVKRVESSGNGEKGMAVYGDAIEVVDVDLSSNDGNGLEIGAAATGDVTVKNASIADHKGSYTSYDGLQITGGKTVTVDNATVARSSADGIRVWPGDVSGQSVDILNSSVTGNAENGVEIDSDSSSDDFSIDTVTSNENGIVGFWLGGQNISIADSSASGNDEGGLYLDDIERSEATITNSDV